MTFLVWLASVFPHGCVLSLPSFSVHQLTTTLNGFDHGKAVVAQIPKLLRWDKFRCLSSEIGDEELTEEGVEAIRENLISLYKTDVVNTRRKIVEQIGVRVSSVLWNLHVLR